MPRNLDASCWRTSLHGPVPRARGRLSVSSQFFSAAWINTCQDSALVGISWCGAICAKIGPLGATEGQEVSRKTCMC